MKKIMMAWDGSETAVQAFEKAAELAAHHGAELHVVSMAETPDYADTVGEYEGALEDATRFYNRKQDVLEETVVDVFLPSEKTPEIAEDAVRAGAKVLWLQEGIENEEAHQIAEEGGLTYIEDRCMKQTHEGLQ